MNNNSPLSTNHYDSLIEVLKCNCGSYLETPIFFCQQGHSCCKKCKRKYQKCNVCQERFTDTRSVILDSLADKMQFPCPNQGCDVRISLSLLEDHEKSCIHRLTNCLMTKIYGKLNNFDLGKCNWKGKASDWLEHCVIGHKEHVTDLPFVYFNDVWSPKQRDPVMRYHILRCYEKTFNVYQIYDSKSGKMMWTVIATGNVSTKNENFYFDLEISNPENPMKRISFRQPCKAEEDSDILDANQNILLPLEQIIYMLDKQGRLHFKLTINSSLTENV